VMLIGPDAPIVLDHIHGTHIEHVYDFYKPRLEVEYPTVDGQLSIQCYLKALDSCYDLYSNKFKEVVGSDFSMKSADYFVFHSPYNGLVRKSVGRLVFNDFLRNPDLPEFKSIQKYRNQQRSESYFNKGIANDFQKLSGPAYKEKIEPSTLLSLELGNCYTASLYAGLLSLIDSKGDQLVGKRIVLFSYGSGMAATMFSVTVRSSLEFIRKISRLPQRLQERKFIEPTEYVQIMELREKRLLDHSYVPVGSLGDLFPGTFYLEKIDDKYRRYYKRSPKTTAKL